MVKGLPTGIPLDRGVSLRPYTTLKAGGPAEFFTIAPDIEALARAAFAAHATETITTVIGWGSNMLPSDDGVPGLAILNHARTAEVERDGTVRADTGIGLQDLWLKTAQAGLSGLEFAVGIPGTVGGALVSNAGAYRSCISDRLTELEIVHSGERKWVTPNYMGFAYRDSVLRSDNPPPIIVLQVRFQLTPADPKMIYDEARDHQRQRISKQPPPASAGSFFKNVNDKSLADSLDTLPAALKAAGVVPAGYLIEAAGLKGFRMGGAMQGSKHANFILNTNNASAFDIRRLAEYTKAVVEAKFAVRLEEEVLYLGDWSNFKS